MCMYDTVHVGCSVENDKCVVFHALTVSEPYTNSQPTCRSLFLLRRAQWNDQFIVLSLEESPECTKLLLISFPMGFSRGSG